MWLDSARVCISQAPPGASALLQFLPTKLAEWIGENKQDELGFPDKQDPANKWVFELNDILHVCVVRDHTHVVLDSNGC